MEDLVLMSKKGGAWPLSRFSQDTTRDKALLEYFPVIGEITFGHH